MSDKWRKGDLYWKIDYEGGASYFTGYGPVPADEVDEDIRDLWIEVTARAKDFDDSYQRLMAILSQHEDEIDDYGR